MSRVFYDLSKTYIEPDEILGWRWGIYDVPVNRGIKVLGYAPFRWLAYIKLSLSKHRAKKYGFVQ